MTDKMIDCWNWTKPIFSSEEIHKLNKIINERYVTTESIEDGAKDLDGNYLKNIKPKIIFYKDIREEIYNLIENAYFHCHYSFGFTTFPVNSWDELLYNEYASDIKGRYDEHQRTIMRVVILSSMVRLKIFLECLELLFYLNQV